MANKCKSCIGKYGHIQLAKGMVMEAISWLKLPKLQIGRSQCERTHRSTVRFNWEGRACRYYAKAAMVKKRGPSMNFTTSPVLQGRHAMKAMEAKSGDLAPSANGVLKRAGRNGNTVHKPAGEKTVDAVRGVGGGNSINDNGININPKEKSAPACIHDCPVFMNGPILPKGGRRLCFT